VATVPRSIQVAVIGGGPGGYAAAFLAADLGLQVTLIDAEPNPGGVCLYRGCIPSKALLHVAKVIGEARQASDWGVTFGDPRINVDALRTWKADIVGKLTGGLGDLCRRRKVAFMQGRAAFRGANALVVDTESGAEELITFEHAILATGSYPAFLPNLAIDSSRVLDSTAALALPDVPESLLVVGGGYIGLELGSVYAALGSRVSVVETTSGLLPSVDRDLVRVLSRRLQKRFAAVMLDTTVAALQEAPEGVRVRFEGAGMTESEQVYGKVLVAVGRRPQTDGLGLENTRVALDAHGFVKVDPQRRTHEPTIYAVGDITGEPMLAHKAAHEGRVAAETIAGKKTAFEPQAIPAVVFTDPEIAWCGLTESEAKQQQRDVTIARFPWAASGRALTLGHSDGVTKLIIDPETQRVLGVGIAGSGAGEMIAEGVLAVEMAALASDLSLSIHPHPTLSESLTEAADVFFGQSTHVYRPPRAK
jgi:dihydrolipoamide dehydrogenase